MLKVFLIIAAIQHATARIKRFRLFLAPCGVVSIAADLMQVTAVNYLSGT